MLFTNERETLCRCVFFSPKPKTSSVPRRTGGYQFRKSTPKKQDAYLSRFTASLWTEKARSWRWQAQRYNRRPKSCLMRTKVGIKNRIRGAYRESRGIFKMGFGDRTVVRASPFAPCCHSHCTSHTLLTPVRQSHNHSR